MPASGTSLGARLKRLEAAKARAASLKRGIMLPSRPMSDMLGVSWPVLRDWCSEIDGFEASDAFTRGGNGIEWAFDPRKTTAYLLKHFRAREAREARKSRAITKAVGVSMSDAETAPSLAETKTLIELTMTVTSAKEKQGGYTPTDETRDFIIGYNQAVVEGILGVRTKIDPSGALPPAVRQAVDDQLRALVVRINGAAAKFIEGRTGARLQQGGTR